MTDNKDDAVSNSESHSSAGVNTALQTTPDGSQFQFSKELREFYEGHNCNVSGDSLSFHCPYRYVRLNPRYDTQESLEMLRSEVRDHRENNSSGQDTTSMSNDNNTSPETTDVLSVPWLEARWAFYALPANFSLSTSQCFRSGRIYGMDVSSGAGVAVLLTDVNDHDAASESEIIQTNAPTGSSLDGTGELRILDLCCSPGLKLLQMADFFHRQSLTNSNGDTKKQRPVKVVGVDICQHRINVCKNIVQKYFIDPKTSGRGEGSSNETPDNVGIQLYLEDGTTFGVKQLSNDVAPASNGQSGNLVFDSGVATEEVIQRGGKRKRMNKSARAREKKRLRQIATMESDFVRKEAHSLENESHCKDYKKDSQNCIGLFDYVLVDAECSTDGSFKHIKERIKESSYNEQNKDVGHREENTRLTDPDKLEELVDLQRKLIDSGFRLLKNEGTLVYSTCSLSEDQNEMVVRWLLESHRDAVLIPTHFPSIKESKFVTEGSLKGTVRFYPNLVHDTKPTTLLLGDGFFVAKIRKISNKI